MTTNTVTLFLALLAVVAEAAVVSAIVLLVSSRFSATAERWRVAAVEMLGPSSLWLAFAVAAVSMAGSLYLSEHAGFVPCKLCWYQRIAMYPLVPILAIAAWRRDARIRPYVIVLASLGGAISTYHMLLERGVVHESSSICDLSNPCTFIWVQRFGYLTIPTMALSAFALIVTLASSAGADVPDDDGAIPPSGEAP